MRKSFGGTRKLIAKTFLSIIVVAFVIGGIIILAPTMDFTDNELAFLTMGIPSIIFGLSAFMLGETATEIKSKKDKE